MKTRNGSAFHPRVRRSSPPHASGSSPTTPAAAPAAAPTIVASSAATSAAAQGSVAMGSSSAAPTSHPPSTEASGDTTLGLAPLNPLYHPGGPHRLRGQGPTVATPLGPCWSSSSGPVPSFHHPAATFPL